MTRVDVSEAAGDWTSTATAAPSHPLNFSHESFEIVGPPGAPVVVVLGGISANRHVTRSSVDPRPGWWEQFCGPGRAINTDRFRILSIDYVSVGRDGRSPTTYDQALAVVSALDSAGVKSVRAVVGASYGGMIALAFGAIASQRVRRLVVIGAAHESAPSATALRLLQRRVVELGLATGKSHEALVLARGIAVTSYASADDFDRRFAGAANHNAEKRSDAIGDFLQLSGETFARNCTPERFLALSESLDSHHVTPEEIRVPTTLIAVREDSLVPIEQVQHLARNIGASCRLVELSSSHGHDTFLNAHHLIAPFVADALFTTNGIES